MKLHLLLLATLATLSRGLDCRVELDGICNTSTTPPVGDEYVLFESCVEAAIQDNAGISVSSEEVALGALVQGDTVSSASGSWNTLYGPQGRKLQGGTNYCSGCSQQQIETQYHFCFVYCGGGRRRLQTFFAAPGAAAVTNNQAAITAQATACMVETGRPCLESVEIVGMTCG